MAKKRLTQQDLAVLTFVTESQHHNLYPVSIARSLGIGESEALSSCRRLVERGKMAQHHPSRQWRPRFRAL